MEQFLLEIENISAEDNSGRRRLESLLKDELDWEDEKINECLDIKSVSTISIPCETYAQSLALKALISAIGLTTHVQRDIQSITNELVEDELDFEIKTQVSDLESTSIETSPDTRIGIDPPTIPLFDENAENQASNLDSPEELEFNDEIPDEETQTGQVDSDEDSLFGALEIETEDFDFEDPADGTSVEHNTLAKDIIKEGNSEDDSEEESNDLLFSADIQIESDAPSTLESTASERLHPEYTQSTSSTIEDAEDDEGLDFLLEDDDSMEETLNDANELDKTSKQKLSNVVSLETKDLGNGINTIANKHEDSVFEKHPVKAPNHDLPKNPGIENQQIVDAPSESSPSKITKKTTPSHAVLISFTVLLLAVFYFAFFQQAGDTSEDQAVFSTQLIDQLVKQNRIQASSTGSKGANSDATKVSQMPKTYHISISNKHEIIEGTFDTTGDIISRINLSYDDLTGSIPSKEEYTAKKFNRKIRSFNISVDQRASPKKPAIGNARIYYREGDISGKMVKDVYLSFDPSTLSVIVRGNLDRSDDSKKLSLVEAGESGEFSLIGHLKIKAKEKTN